MTNEYEPDGVTHAATEVIDGVTYEVFYLTDDDANNRSIIGANNKNTNGNYRYVMTADWTIKPGSSNIALYGARAILDLNGYTLVVSSSGGKIAQVEFHADTSEIADSSANGTGVIDNATGCTAAWFTPCATFIISGGTCTKTQFHNYAGSSLQIIISGGHYTNDVDIWTLKNNRFVTIAPYLFVDSHGGFQPYDIYAVSTTPYASGIYNYAYGLVWEIDLPALRELTIPAGKIYYLWARNDGDAWYQYLNSIYVDGAWRNAA